jgi:RNA polymerase sigma factor (sigma-70 family)
MEPRAVCGEVGEVEPGDADVVRASVAQPELFETIFGRHHARIWAFLARRGGREWADEVAGDVFVSAFAQRARYEPARGSVVAWLYGIAINLTRSRFRRETRASRALARVAAREAVGIWPIDDAVEALCGRQELVRVQEALAQLPGRDRELIVLVAWEGLSYAEIAAVLGMELGTVRSRLSRARRRLRELAGTDGEETGDPAHPRRKVTDG